jgi:hypothetical protein
MRLLVLSVSVLCAACLGATCAIAQTGQWGQAEDQVPPYRTHIDRRHGNDHAYPDRGAVVRDVPQGAIAVNYAGLSYRFAGGVWYERLGPAYIVVAPPIGLVVPQLPAFATRVDSAGQTYLYADDVFYRPRPDLGGYEVANDPEDLAPEASQAPVGASSSRVASAGPIVPEAPAQAPAQTPTQAPAPASAQTLAQAPVQPKSEPFPPATPAATPSSDSSVPANPTGVAIHPQNGQSLEQQAMDRYECYRFAVGQAGFDPLASNGSMPQAEVAQHDSEYSRAQAACLEGRGYTVQ